MRRAGNGGSVIILSSVAGLRGAIVLAGYSATKGAVRLFAKSMALDCAQVRDGIRVNSVHPGIIATPIWAKMAPGGLTTGDPEPGISRRHDLDGIALRYVADSLCPNLRLRFGLAGGERRGVCGVGDLVLGHGRALTSVVVPSRKVTRSLSVTGS